MSKRPLPIIETAVEKIIGGGQALGTMPGGRKLFIWGALPGETARVQITRKKSHFCEGTAVEIIASSEERLAPRDPETYLSTSPWQIMTFTAEQHYKSALIEEAFELHDIVLPGPITVATDDQQYEYRNKIEFSWYGEQDATYSADTLDLAFFRRGSKGKVIARQMSLARPEIMKLAFEIRDLLRTKPITARNLKTLLIRCSADGSAVWQLYVKDELPDLITTEEAATFSAKGGEIIYSDPRSPASRITKRLAHFGDVTLTDTILGVPFRYATEGFFQVNLPVYEMALREMRQWVDRRQHAKGNVQNGGVVSKDQDKRVTEKGVHPLRQNLDFDEDGANFLAGPASSDLRADFAEAKSNDGSEGSKKTDDKNDWIPDQVGNDNAEVENDDVGAGGDGAKVLDLYSGVGTIGLTIGGDNCTLIEIDENAVREMKRNIEQLGSNSHAVLAPSEKALDYITGDKTIIVDPPRAGLHADVTARLLETAPPRIIYLSCNPVTQARDVALLCEGGTYGIRSHQGYNFFPRTPHIEHLVVLDRKS